MRIAVLSRNFDSRGGGAERYAIALVEQWASIHEVHVFAQHYHADIPGVVFHRIPAPLGRPRWINQLYFAWVTWQRTRTGFDVVHSHENTWHGDVQTVHVLPIKYTLFHGRSGVTKALRWLKVLTSPRLLAYLALEAARYRIQPKRRVVAISGSLQTIMQQTYPHTTRMMEMIAPGVTAAPGLADAATRQAARHSLGLPLDATCLAFVGNDFRKKGLPTLLQALAQLPPDVCLCVVGSSSQCDSMRQLATQHGVNSRVYFVGAQRDMSPVYQAADALVHPTTEDTYAMVVLEAMAHGVPVVVSGPTYCGIAHELQHLTHALIVDEPLSVSALAGAIGRVVSDAPLRASLSAQGQQFVQSRTWVAAARRYNDLFSRVRPSYRARWLVLAHAFNMDGRAASQTITDKLPHLEKAGIEVVVLSGVSGLRDTQVEHHQLWPAGPAGIRFELRHVLGRRLGRGLSYRALMALASVLLLPGMVVEKLFWRMESSWSWWLSAYAKGWQLAAGRSFDLIYSTGGAFGAHIAAKHLKDVLQISWLAEVHDPFVVPGQSVDDLKTPQQRKQLQVEQMIADHADVAVWFTEAALASARRRHPQLGARGHALLPGIDAFAQAIPAYQRSNKFVIGHFGSLSPTRNLVPIFEALAQWAQEQPGMRQEVELHVYGGPLDAVSAQALASSPIRDLVHHFGRLELDPVTGLSGRTRVLHRMRGADVLLLLHGEEPICAEYIPSKLYEYLWMQRPIVATVYQHPQMQELITAQGHHVVPYGDSQLVAAGLAATLQRLFAQWKEHGLPDNGQASPHTTGRAVEQLTQWAFAIQALKK